MIKIKLEFENPKQRFLIYANNFLHFLIGFFSQIIQYLTFGVCKITVESRDYDVFNSCYHFGAGMAFGLFVVGLLFGVMWIFSVISGVL